MKKLLITVILLMCGLFFISTSSPNINGDGQVLENSRLHIYIENNQFMVDGKRIWINGVNTPWNNWNDFGGNYNDAWWNNHFAELKRAGINATRVWINCDGYGSININANGIVSGATVKHWSDLDRFFATAERNQIYIMATLLSFDHFDSDKRNYTRWRRMLSNNTASLSFVENYTIPFVTRYRDNPWLWSIDIMNEPDWVFENPKYGNISWERISFFLAANAAAIKTHSSILVTVGMAFPKYNADGSGYEGNKVSNSFLQRQYRNPNAYLDFWSPHYYDWVGQWYGVPFYSRPYGARPAGWGLCNTKPALIGESSAKGSAGRTLIDDYLNAFNNGWQGVMAWTSNGVDANGDLNDIRPATIHMLANHRRLIFPHE
jgi:hypothetical protein